MEYSKEFKAKHYLMMALLSYLESFEPTATAEEIVRKTEMLLKGTEQKERVEKQLNEAIV